MVAKKVKAWCNVGDLENDPTEEPSEKEMATHTSTLYRKFRTEELCVKQSMELQRVKHDCQIHHS